MEENTNQEEQKTPEPVQPALPEATTKDLHDKKKKKHHPVVVIERDWKEYLGECLLIVFSVALAIGITEYLTSLHEQQQTNEVLHQLREELIQNKESEEIQYAYHLQVLKNIDSALRNPSFAEKFIHNDSLNLKVVAPQGVLRRDLNDVAWEIAKQNNIFSKIDLATYSLLTQIYVHQQRITNSEEEIAKVLLSFESRRPENLRTTLILLSDNYHGWDVDRVPGLMKLYEKAIDKLAKY